MKTLTVDIVSDFVCPWCWIGKRGLDTLRAERSLVTRWHPYLLHPDMPKGGVDRREFSRAKFGSDERARELARGVEAAAAEAGLTLDLSRVTRIPDTRDAHRLMRWAQGLGTGDAVGEALFRAHFAEGRDIGDAATLAEIGGAAGMDTALVAELLAGDSERERVESEAQKARDLDISGVPTMVFNGRLSVIGAQSIERLRKAADKAVAA